MAAMMTQMSTSIAALSSSVALLPTSTDISNAYLTQQMAAQTYAPNASLASYATVTESIERDDATRIFATGLVDVSSVPCHHAHIHTALLVVTGRVLAHLPCESSLVHTRRSIAHLVSANPSSPPVY